MKSRIRDVFRPLLPAVLSLTALSAQATVFEGSLSGPTTRDVYGGPLTPWAEIHFRYDSATTPYHLYASSTASHASYFFDSTTEPGSSEPLSITGPGLGPISQGMFNSLDLYNDVSGQRVEFSSGSLYFGGMRLTLAGPVGAFFSNAMDLSTLHPGLVYSNTSSGYFTREYSRFDFASIAIYNPSVVFTAAVPEPETWLLMSIGLAACLWLARRRAYPALTGYVPSP